jgi:hypothetical protein
MIQRLTHISMTAWWLLWVLFVIPCHTIGAIPLGGSHPECDKSVSLFFGDLPCCCCAPKSPDSHSHVPEKRSSGNCAICHLTATTPYVPPSLALQICLLPQEILQPCVPSGAIHYLPLRPYHSRAPPIA